MPSELKLMTDMKKIFDERGFMLLQVIFLTLMTSFAGMIFLNGMKKADNQNATFRIIALHLAEEQFAELENSAANGSVSSSNFLGEQDDLKTYFDSNDKKINSQVPVNFKVTTNINNLSGNLFKAAVKVSWNYEGKNNLIELQKIIRKKTDEQDNE